MPKAKLKPGYGRACLKSQYLNVTIDGEENVVMDVLNAAFTALSERNISVQITTAITKEAAA